MNKVYNFMNTVRVQTDHIGHHSKQWIKVGMNSYVKDPEIHERGVFSFDEVRELYEKKLTTENFAIDEQGTPYLKKEHLVAQTAFQVVNGIAFGGQNHPNILKYCRKEGIVFDSPQPVHMMAGTKTMEILSNDKYRFQYTLVPENVGLTEGDFTLRQREWLGKLIIGAFKKLIAKTYHDGKESHPYVHILDYNYEPRQLWFSYIVDREFVASQDIQSMVEQLDLQIYYLFNPTLQWEIHLKALMQCARDEGQSHLIQEDWDNPESNLKWFEKNDGSH